MLSGIIRLDPEEAKRLYSMIRSFLDEHAEGGGDGTAWEYALIAYPVEGEWTMRRSLQLIVFLKNFSAGVMAPVLSLALLAHGASIGTVSLMIGAYSLTVIAAEFPSGIFADVYGRKKAFLLAIALYFLSYGLMLPFRSAAVLFSAMVANGLGRAFSSGSLEALAIDEAGAGDGALVRITSRFSIWKARGSRPARWRAASFPGWARGMRATLG